MKAARACASRAAARGRRGRSADGPILKNSKRQCAASCSPRCHPRTACSSGDRDPGPTQQCCSRVCCILQCVHAGGKRASACVIVYRKDTSRTLALPASRARGAHRRDRVGARLCRRGCVESHSRAASMAFVPEEKGFFGRIASSVQRVFVPPPDPQEAVKEWTKSLRVEKRNVDKSIRGARLHRWPCRCTLQVAMPCHCASRVGRPHDPSTYLYSRACARTAWRLSARTAAVAPALQFLIDTRRACRGGAGKDEG